MTVDFWKMHGAGNDFVLIDDRDERLPCDDRKRVAAVCDRRRGVGSDGLILIRPSREAHFRMRFFNPDGGEAEFCGNGARCVARLAHRLKLAPAAMTIETSAGHLLAADVSMGGVRIGMPPPSEHRPSVALALSSGNRTVGYVNTGVPHVVVECDALDELDIDARGAELRYHAAFAPAGTNVNFTQVTGPKSCRVRTYERGVEGETLACGTGITAVALVLSRAGRTAPPVTVTARGGDELTVNFEQDDAGNYTNVSLTGPAEFVFHGTLEDF